MIAYQACEARHGADMGGRGDLMAAVKLGRNDFCACGSGRKYKKCCMARPAAGGAAAAAIDIDAEMARAGRLHLAGRTGQAESHYHQVLVSASNNPATLYTMGQAALQRGDYPAAVACIEKALAFDGRHPHYHYDLARAYDALDRLPEAVGFYLAAVSLQSEFTEAADALSALLDRHAIRTVKVTILHYHRIGELGLIPDLALRRQQLEGAEDGCLHLYISGEKPANRQLLEMLKRYLCLIESDLLLAGLHRWIPNLSGVDKLIDVDYAEERIFNMEVGGRRIINQPPHRQSNEYDLYQATTPALAFTPEEQARGRDGLRAMGLDPDKDWFVCLFTRDPVYLSELLPGHRFDDTRNADIDSYALAARCIVEAGGHVIRMGHGVAKPFGLSHERVIDYALECRDDFMDVYLMGHCRFVLGTTSGICDIAMLFDVPRIGTNWLPLGSAPLSRNSLFIPKLLRDRGSGELLPFGRFLEDTRGAKCDLLWSPANRMRFVFEDNTPEDILAVTEEMLLRLDGSFAESDEDRAMQAGYFGRFPADHWSAEGRTPIGRDFLAKHRTYFLES